MKKIKIKYCYKEITDLHNLNKYKNDKKYYNYFDKYIEELIKTLNKKTFLVGSISLFCLIEITGRKILNTINSKQNINNKHCFDYFLNYYMGYSELLKIEPKIYDILRNGLVHEGLPKFRKSGSFGAGYTKFTLNRLKIKHNQMRGIIYRNNEMDVFLDILLLEYLEGLKKFRNDPKIKQLLGFKPIHI